MSAVPRLAAKSAIRRAMNSARRNLTGLDRESQADLRGLYQSTAQDLARRLEEYADGSGNLRAEVLQDMLRQTNERLARLGEDRDALLNSSMHRAAVMGTAPWAADPGLNLALPQLADEAVRFVRDFVHDDGLQLSDRLWRLDRQARQAVGEHLESAVLQGQSASRAAREFMARGEEVPRDVLDKMNAARADQVGRRMGSALLRDEDSAYANARRVFRTEINRAHGEAFRAGMSEHPEVIGERFVLSPAHPRPDICDMHASVNLHGLGPGVYPVGKSPWPAHPNTLSYLEPVFEDEVSQSDRAGKIDRLDWLKGQPPGTRIAVLGQGKSAALERGILRENQIGTPWRVLKQRYERQGIDLSDLRPTPPPPPTGPATVVIGNYEGSTEALQRYVMTAMDDAPDLVRRAALKAPPVSSISMRQSGRGSYYLPGDDLIVLVERDTTRPDMMSRHSVYLHEFGHHVDFTARGGRRRLSLTPDSEGGVGTAIADAKHALRRLPATEKLRIDTMLKGRSDGALADVFGALTRNRVGWGHEDKYFSRPGNAETEVFANLWDIYTRQDESLEILRRELPGLVRGFEAMLRRMTQ